MMGRLISKTMNVFDGQTLLLRSTCINSNRLSVAWQHSSHLRVHEHALAGRCTSGGRFEHGYRLSRLGQLAANIMTFLLL
jgi:hypothetical protein